jgi:copper transport protein
VRRAAVAVALGAAALVAPASALAHAQLVRSVPADRAVLASAPREVRFFFDDVVRAGSGIRAVRNGDGSVLGGKPRVVGGRMLVIPLQANLRDGDYTVLWRVISDDGHEIAGVISFAVGAGRAPPTPSLAAENGPSATDVLSRWLFLGGILVAGGGALFRLIVGTGRVTALVPAFVLAFLGGSALLGHQESLSTRFGLAVAAATVVAAVGAMLAAITTVGPRAAAAAWGCGLLLLPAPSFAGHALDAGRPRIEVVVDVLHMTAAAAWVGGLVQLALVLRRGRGGLEPARRFSLLAVCAVVGLSATGVARAFAELDSVQQVWSTGYGRLLVVKTSLLAALVVLGWFNRYRLLPGGALRSLGTTVRAELVLVAGLVVAVAILTDVRPGRDREAVAAAVSSVHARPALPPTNAFVVAAEDGDRAVALALARRRLRATVLGPDGAAVDGLELEIAGRAAAPCGPGCYEVDVPTPLRRAVAVVVDGRSLSFPLPSRLRPAAGVVARATRAFERLRNVSYVERLASSPRDELVSRFTLEAPNRFSYRVRGGPSAIVVGARRWDRARGGRWDETQTTPLSQPTPIWEGPVTNAYVLSRSRRDVVVTFLNRRAPAWFTVRLDRGTLLPRELRMTAAAHFMRHRYFGFNTPRRVFPPR